MLEETVARVFEERYNKDMEEEEEEEGEEDEEDEEEDNEDGEYRLRFEGEMDPLEFAKNDAFGVEPYQQFERLEYQTLAERKRKALTDRLLRDESAKKARQEDVFGASVNEIMEMMDFSLRRKSRKPKKRGRRKGSKNKLSPVVTRKLGDATLHYASGNYDEAIRVLEEVVRLAPNLADPYHTLGLVYNALGDKKKALNFYMIAAHLSPKDPSLWKLLVAWSIEQGNTGQVRYCLSKAIMADPKDLSLRFDRASLYIELGDYQKAAESYDQILGICPVNIDACKMAAKMYQKCGQVERAISILEDYIRDHLTQADLSVVGLLASVHMENKAPMKALQQIEHARSVFCSGKELPLHLTVKAGICQAQLGNMEKAEILLRDLQIEQAKDHGDIITEVADVFVNLGHYESALKFYFMLEGNARHDNGFLHLKIAHCYLSLEEKSKAILFFYKGLSTMEENINARITLASLLVDEGKEDEAITVLSPPKILESTTDENSTESKSWWLSGKVKMQLAQIYHAKGRLEDFVDEVFPPIRETLLIEMETMNRKVRIKKKLSRSVLFERIKVLDERQTDNVFQGFRPIAAPSDLLKASRAKKSLQKKAAIKEGKRAAAMAAGLDWQSDDSDDEPPRKAVREPPLPELLKDEQQYQIIIDLCKALASLRRYWEAIELINDTLRLAYNTFSVEKKEELRSLGAKIACNTTDPTHGYDCTRHSVQKRPYSLAAWNCYYKVVSRLESRFSKHAKFLHSMRVTHADCVPPMIITGHQLTIISQHQAAAREYLEAYKVQPDNPLINLCVGTCLINLALGFRVQNRNQCVAQGFAFLYNNLRLCQNNQEALYNIARAYHHVGLVTLAASYYEKVLAIHEKDYPIPKLFNEDSNLPENMKPGYCNLQREAAYNLHLIYKKSGALDLARQVLKDYCNP